MCALQYRAIARSQLLCGFLPSVRDECQSNFYESVHLLVPLISKSETGDEGQNLFLVAAAATRLPGRATGWPRSSITQTIVTQIRQHNPIMLQVFAFSLQKPSIAFTNSISNP